MDISFVVENEKFNYRVCGIIISNGKILAMHNERSPYYFLPGGRVKMGETAENAIIREIKEELDITPTIVRPLWLHQSFFKEEIDHLNYHELCIYFLLDISNTNILINGDKFTRIEHEHKHVFELVEFSRLKNEYFYPLFLKEKIYDLPQSLTLLTTYESKGSCNV